jgi:hypothetical protein
MKKVELIIELEDTADSGRGKGMMFQDIYYSH